MRRLTASRASERLEALPLRLADGKAQGRFCSFSPCRADLKGSENDYCGGRARLEPQRQINPSFPSSEGTHTSVLSSLEAAPSGGRVTLRAVSIGTLCCLLIGIGAPYSTH